MAASPLNGDRPPLTPGLRRTFTQPTKSLSVREQAIADRSDATADILYSHPQVRMFRFSPPKESIKSDITSKILPDTDYPVDTVETLPWRSRTETMAATGRLVIEKVAGSTNFLKCQAVTQAILRNSQCWCVDGESKFVLRVRAFEYYRIELPSTTDEDKIKVEELKSVLLTVLRYERTPCPFIRAFQVSLPDDAITPRRKGAWKRRDSSQHKTPEVDLPSARHSKATRSWSLRTPPSAYPKNGPSYLTSPVDGRPPALSNVRRRGSLLEYTERPGSAASNAPSDEGPDSERSGSENDQEQGSDSEELPESPIAEDNRGRQTALTNRDGRSVSVSARVAAFEFVRANSSTRPKLDRDVSATRFAVDIRPQTKSPAPSTSPLRVSKILNSDVEEVSHQPLPEQRTDSSDTKSYPEAGIPDELATLSDHDTDSLENDTVSQLPSTAHKSADSQPFDVGSTALDHPQSDGSAEDTVSDVDDTDQEEFTPILNCESSVTEVREVAATANVSKDEEQLEQTGCEEAPTPEISENKDFNHERQTDLVASTQTQGHATLETDELNLKDTISAQDRITEPLPPSMVIQTEQDNIEGSKNDGGDDNNSGHDSEDDNISTVSSVDSFHTMTSSLPRSYSGHGSTFSGSPRVEQQGPFSDLPHRHRREESQATVTASTTSDPDELDTKTPLPRAIDNPSESIDSSALNQALSNTMTATTSAIDTGVRQRITGRRSFSPLPPASTLFTGNQQRSASSHRMARTIVQNVILKPIGMITFIVQVLSRIAGGATVNDLLSGELFRSPDHQRGISESARQNNGMFKDDDTDDDYGIPIRGRSRFIDQRGGGLTSPANGYERDNDADSFTSVD